MSSGNRYGVSALSKNKFIDAYKEEIMVDKLTGEFIIKSKTGDVISYDYNNRVKSAVDDMRVVADKLGVYGDIYNIRFDEVCPFVITPNSNYLSNELTIPFNGKKMLVYVDIDCVSTSENSFSIDKIDIETSIGFRINYTDGTSSGIITMSKTTSEWNSYLIDLSLSEFGIINYKEIESLTISRFSIGSADNSRAILNGLYTVLEVVE